MLTDTQSPLPSWGSSFSGKGFSFGDQLRQCDQMRAVMLMAIGNLNLSTAQRALSALLSIDPSLKINPILMKIQNALIAQDADNAREVAKELVHFYNLSDVHHSH